MTSRTMIHAITLTFPLLSFTKYLRSQYLRVYFSLLLLYLGKSNGWSCSWPCVSTPNFFFAKPSCCMLLYVGVRCFRSCLAVGGPPSVSGGPHFFFSFALLCCVRPAKVPGEASLRHGPRRTVTAPRLSVQISRLPVHPRGISCIFSDLPCPGTHAVLVVSLSALVRLRRRSIYPPHKNRK